MTAEEELIYMREELKRYTFCLKLCIEIITGVCDNKITLEQMRNFRKNMDKLGDFYGRN